MKQPSGNKKPSNGFQEVQTRLVLNFPGFEQTDSVAQLGRLRYGAEQTGTIWGFKLKQGEISHPDNSHHAAAEDEQSY